MILKKAYPVKPNDTTWPKGVETLSTAMALARSVSENHLFAMIICELRKIDDTVDIMNVPSRIGHHSSF